MPTKYYAALTVALVMWASWFYRYDISDFHGITLDRWTGMAILPIRERKVDLSEIQTEEEIRAAESARP